MKDPMSITATLAQIRADLTGRTYLSQPLYYDTSKGRLEVVNAADHTDNGPAVRVGEFVAQLLDANDTIVRTYKV